MQHTDENQTGFYLYSDRVVTLFPGYIVDPQMRIRPGPDTPVVNFNYLKELLLSKDFSRSGELDWIA